MAKRSQQTKQSRLYCLNCGKENIPIYRPAAHVKEPKHRKKMYCPWCKVIVNMIECRDDKEIEKFKKDFEDGVYIEEARENIEYLKKESIFNV